MQDDLPFLATNMKIVFLSAEGLTLAKQFGLDSAGQLTKTSYPSAYAFTSHEEQIADLPALADRIRHHGALGHCLLKGEIGRPLVAESRAGATSSDTPTDWMCFDLDGAPFFTPDQFMGDVGLHDVSYVLQWSASQGIEPGAMGLRCHIFVQLSAPQHPTLLKQWLQHLNLTSTPLRNSLTLTRTANSLHWPLDVTTCQNDKLLYIAPPILLDGIVDPFTTNRVSYIKKSRETFLPPPAVPGQSVIRQLTDDAVNNLRKAQGLPKRRASAFKMEGQIEYMVKPDTALVTGIKGERNFVYLNLNGGDSWAYFHPEDNYDFVFNFKGEPIYKTQELLPQYHAQCVAAERRARREAAADSPRIYLAFRDFQSAMYWNGWYDESTDDLVLNIAKGEQQLRHFLKQHGEELGDFIPDWTMKFDPHDQTRLDMQRRIVNTFRPSPFMKMDVEPRNEAPATCATVIAHALGGDPQVIDHFHNWMACIFQYLERTLTGWVLSGTQGTGKGLMVNRILMPLLGPQNMTAKRMEELEENFTGFFENQFIVVVDEVQASSSPRMAKITSKLKNLMVEPVISIRKMYREQYMAKNYCNFIFTSNKADPVEVAADDRRFNVGGYQTEKLQVTNELLEQLDGELYDMYCFWMSYPADQERAMRPLDTQARQELIDTNMLSAEAVAKALIDGDMPFFYDLLPTEAPVILPNTIPSLSHKDTLTAAYRELVRDIVVNNETKLTRDNLMTLFRYAVGQIPESPHKFTAYLTHRRIHMEYVWKGSRSVRGITVQWRPEPAWLAQAQKDLA